MSPPVGLENPAFLGSLAIGGWKELGRTTLGVAGDALAVSSLSDKRFYMVLVNGLSTGSNIQTYFRFNSDTGSNYSYRRGLNGTESAAGNTSAIYGAIAPTTEPNFLVSYVANVAAREKLQVGHSVGVGAAGEANAPNRGEFTGKHVQTSVAINKIDAFNLAGSSAYAIGSEIVVLGWDETDTHTSNFWEPLATANASGSEDSFNTGTFTPKKYLWVQVYGNSSSGNVTMQVGNTTLDTADNYADRGSDNGGGDFTETSTSDHIQQSSSDDGVLLNVFIVNNAAEEKLATGHSITIITTGAATAPKRRVYAGKWDNTSDLIDIIGVYNTAATNYTATTQINVWGHD